MGVLKLCEGSGVSGVVISGLQVSGFRLYAVVASTNLRSVPS